MPYSYNLGKRLFKLPEAGKRQRGRPLKVKSGLRGRPKILPSGTMEWLRQSLNNDVFFFIFFFLLFFLIFLHFLHFLLHFLHKKMKKKMMKKKMKKMKKKKRNKKKMNWKWRRKWRKKKTSHKHGGGESSFLGCFAFALL